MANTVVSLNGDTHKVNTFRRIIYGSKQIKLFNQMLEIALFARNRVNIGVVRYEFSTDPIV